jgi:FtsH-binding integral membrane protein
MDVSQRLPKRKARPLYEARESFLFTLISLIASLVVAYLFAIFAYVFMNHIASIPATFVGEPALQGAFLFIMMAVVTILLIVPQFNSEIEAGTRRFLFIVLVFMIGYTTLKASGMYDPDWPFYYFIAHVITPLQKSINH